MDSPARTASIASTPRTPRGRVRKGTSAEAEVKALLEALGCVVWNFAPNESGADLLAVWVPAEAKRFGPWEGAASIHRWAGLPLPQGAQGRYHAIVEVKSRPWAYLAGSERRACVEAGHKAAAGLCLYWVIAAVPGRNKAGGKDGLIEWEVIVPQWIGGQARILHRWPLPPGPAKGGQEASVGDGSRVDALVQPAERSGRDSAVPMKPVEAFGGPVAGRALIGEAAPPSDGEALQ
jgi:hypothetical protein